MYVYVIYDNHYLPHCLFLTTKSRTSRNLVFVTFDIIVLRADRG